MIKSSESANNSPGQPAVRDLSCWGRDNNCSAVRFELSDGGVVVLPYHYLVRFSFRPGEGGDEMQLTFSSDIVEIRGRQLAELIPALQCFSVAWIRQQDLRRERFLDSEAVVVESLEVIPVSAPKAEDC